MQTNAAVADPTVENYEKKKSDINSRPLHSYLRHPGSGVLAFLTLASSSYFCSAVFSGRIYARKRYSVSEPSLFSLEYTSTMYLCCRH